MRTVPQRPRNLNTWSPIGGAIWGQGLGVYSLALLPVHYLHLVCNWKHHLFASCSNSLLYASPSTGDLPLIFSPTHQEPSAIIDVFIHKLLYSHGVVFFFYHDNKKNQLYQVSCSPSPRPPRWKQQTHWIRAHPSGIISAFNTFTDYLYKIPISS